MDFFIEKQIENQEYRNKFISLCKALLAAKTQNLPLQKTSKIDHKMYKFWNDVIRDNMSSCPFTEECIQAEFFHAVFEKAVQDITRDSIKSLFAKDYTLQPYVKDLTTYCFDLSPYNPVKLVT